MKKGQTVLFDTKDISLSEWEDLGNVVKNHDRQYCIIECIAVDPAVKGDPTTGYYDIKFEDGETIPACSGYHLELK